MSGALAMLLRRTLILVAGIAFMVTNVSQAQNVQGSSHAVSEANESGTSAGTYVGSSSPTAVKPNASYTIGPGDLLSINVWNEPEVTGKVPVRPDGMITVPLIGDVQASGLTPDVLQTTITRKLAEYVKQPSVTVVVAEMNSRQFNVLGQVQHPGTFALNRPTRVLDALAAAGGFSEFAKRDKIYVLRRDAEGTTTRLPFNYKRVARGDDDQNNVELQAGDTVIVP